LHLSRSGGGQKREKKGNKVPFLPYQGKEREVRGKGGRGGGKEEKSLFHPALFLLRRKNKKGGGKDAIQYTIPLMRTNQAVMRERGEGKRGRRGRIFEFI